MTSSHSAAARSASSTASSSSRRGTAAVQAQPVGDVVEDRRRERVGALEHHADAAPHVRPGRWSAGRCPRRRAAPSPRSEKPCDDVVHPVEAAQDGRLAAPRRADERGHPRARHRPSTRRTPPACRRSSSTSVAQRRTAAPGPPRSAPATPAAASLTRSRLLPCRCRMSSRLDEVDDLLGDVGRPGRRCARASGRSAAARARAGSSRGSSIM